MSGNPTNPGDNFHNRSTHPENPATASKELRFGFANSEGSWNEQADIMELFGKALEKAGVQARKHSFAYEDEATGLLFQPRFVEMQPRDDGGSRTVSTVEVSHREQLPGGAFEYQHSTGGSVEEALLSGFESWTEVDLPTFQDAMNPSSTTCMKLEMTFSAEDDQPWRERRVILGPVYTYADSEVVLQEDQHPPFCSCCMFTNIGTAFEDLVKSDGFYAIRLFAIRDVESNSDCRVNGLDHDSGAAALIAYANSWPDRGFEFRKQLVIVQNQFS